MKITYYWKEFVKVQTLFYERRYKQCIALCEQLQRSEIHGLHRAFLWFYHAVCYEAIGLLAHDFSRNKLQFLDSARESFDLAVKSLPMPFASTEAGTYAQIDDSPLTADSHFSLPFTDKVAQTTHATFPQAPRIREGSPFRSPSSSIYSTASPLKAEPISDCDDQSPMKKREHPPIFPTVAEPNEPEDKQPVVPATPATHRTRLSRVLSSPQALQQELVPSPLFSRHAKQARLPQPANGNDIPRPLPPLPFKHNPLSFKTDGTRMTQGPLLRQTVVQTLIARFEGILPLPPSTPLTTAHSIPMTPDIAIPRFRMIREAFSPDPRNEHLETYLTSTASAQLQLARYNAKLADFRARLRDHTAYVDGELARVHKMQNERHAARLLGPKQRYASFWSFEATSSPCPRRRNRPTGCGGGGDAHNGRQPGEDCEEVDQVGVEVEVDGDGNGDGDGEQEDANAKAKKERIARLRQQGWRVRKENHGFKGVQFYENLCSCVENELDHNRLFG
ncbi:hypothetical protein G647_03096 [Cladophialophora carrionii CBS 160.54]|uniref:Uncharacterized protein n=1 Tax=Cladophialophora carrionii CBS 160.54 TaxID=1279043 RepID=V9DHE4_9EURO|nr:uncharacterized protein G647_03096 [Cladophialophora carrionii CBS 160.54]ETI26319.1 hypothetical protein G647_03096 [Cladophialophora carrionii CBS 160.54]